MDHPSAHEYFGFRAEEEREAAEQAADERAARTHRELAEAYEKLAKERGEIVADDELEAGGILSTGFRILP
jgi:hypothetical protein